MCYGSWERGAGCGFSRREFHAFARRERITDDSLSEAIRRAERGLVNADLGGGVIKQRVTRPGQGRSGGYRVLISYRAKHRGVFLYGFAKSEKDNIDPDELLTLREIAGKWLAADTKRIVQALDEGVLQEVTYDEKEKG